MKNMIPISLRQPDKIILHYGNKKVELKNNTPFNDYIVYCKKDEVKDLEPYMSNGEIKK